MFMKTVVLVVVLLGVAVTALFFNQNTISWIRVCINFQTTGFQSTCVLCDANLYSQTALACTGQTSVPPNTNHTQAFCLINLCSNQVKQTPLSLGRKRRQTEDMSEKIDEQVVITSVDNDY